MMPPPEDPVTPPEDEERDFRQSLHALYAKEGETKRWKTRWLLAVATASNLAGVTAMLLLPWPWYRGGYFFAFCSVGLLRLLDEQWMGARRTWTLAFILAFLAAYAIRMIVLPLIGWKLRH